MMLPESMFGRLTGLWDIEAIDLKVVAAVEGCSLDLTKLSTSGSQACPPSAFLRIQHTWFRLAQD